ncbi:MAG: Rid family hydrolase [Rhodospirillales bacterium]|nr:Rid family hydrolase [Rhodospirillales bacterium]
MSIERLNPDTVYKPNKGIYTQVIKASGTQVHVAGLVPWTVDNELVGKDDVAAQVGQILANVENSLAAAGAGKSDVVRINVYTVDVARYIAEGAPVLIEFFGDTKPVSTTVEVSRLVHPDWLVEIEVTAVIGG